jgi:hypothetical protein
MNILRVTSNGAQGAPEKWPWPSSSIPTTYTYIPYNTYYLAKDNNDDDDRSGRNNNNITQQKSNNYCNLQQKLAIAETLELDCYIFIIIL